ncbi:MAG: PhzF family phenazine biosynthesis protein [Coriobacteriia bacterium]|nr:PhzF family phenazine biosynthesis protein [Coriobacteriia bacterium]
MISKVNFTIVDVFTDTPFEGNQLGVFTDARRLSSAQMQTLAKELKFSECAFVLPAETDGHARVRIFTPSEELSFAGHPVLGTAFVLASPMQLGVINIETASGTVAVLLERDGTSISFGRMSQPHPHVEAYDRVGDLLVALGVKRSVLPVETYRNGPLHIMVSLSRAEEVAGLCPDMVRLAAVVGDACVSCFALDGLRVKSRMFAPGMGVDEDPATGSAAGPIALHLSRHEAIRWGDEIEISQGAEIGRPSKLLARATGGDAEIGTIEVGGSARLVARGEFII